MAGRSIRFDPDMLLTLEYGGAYHAYAYDESTVAQLAVSLLEAHAIIDVKMVGDTLWMSTHDDGVYAYSLEDRLSPVLVNHLEIPGCLEAIAVSTDIIAVSYRSGSDEVHILEFGASGETDLLSTIPARNVRQMVFRSNYLVIIGYDTVTYGGDAYLRIVDLDDPGSPETVYSLHEDGGRSGIIHEDYVLLGPNMTESPNSIAYTTIDITDPASPVYVGRTLSDTWLQSVHDESHGVGEYCSDYVACNVYRTLHSVAAGAPESGFQALAILQERTADPWPCVHRPPLFVIGGSLWRLEEDDRVLRLGRAASTP